MTIDELQERWDKAATGRCCTRLCVSGEVSNCRDCLASQVLPTFGLRQTDNLFDCFDLHRLHEGKGYGRFIRRHITWLAGMQAV